MNLFYSRQAKINFVFIVSAILIFAVGLFFANAVNVNQVAPSNNSINSSRNTNFSFTANWFAPGQVVTNCSIWTNLGGTWAQAQLNSSTSSIINFTGAGAISHINFTLSQDGVFNWSVACVNSTDAGVFNFSTNRTLTVDSTPPVVNTTATVSPITGVVFNYTANVTDNIALVSANWTHNASGTVTNAFYVLSGTSAQVSNVTIFTSVGLVNFTVFVTDIAGNVRQNSTLYTVTDTTPPVVNTTFNLSTVRINNVLNFTANITDDTTLSSVNISNNMSGTTVHSVVSLSGASASVQNVTTITASKGTVINFSMAVTDSSGNIRLNQTLITVANTAPTTPSVLNTSGLNVTTNQIINWSASTDADSDSISYTVHFAGGFFTTSDRNFTTNMTTDGRYYFNVSANDGTSSSSNSSVWFITKDTTAPTAVAGTLSNNSAASNFTVNQVARVGVSVTDALTNISSVRLFVNVSGLSNNEVNITYTLNSGIFANLSFAINSSLLNLDLNFTFNANDTLGNSANIGTMIFSVGSDVTAPTISPTLPINAGNQTVGMFIPTITVSSDTSNCTYQINGSGVISMTFSGTTCTGQTERFKNTNSSVSSYNITFNATDSSGNKNSVSFLLNVSDSTAPNAPHVSASSVDSDSAIVTIDNLNETSNATLFYAVQNSSFSLGGTQTDFNTTQEITLSSLSSSTTYLLNITVCDFNGNCAMNNTVNFTTDVASSGSSGSSGGGGGGGGGGGTAISTNVLASTGRIWDTLVAGSTAEMKLSNSQIAVNKIVIVMSNTALKPSINVDSLKQKPLGFADAGAKVYQYLQITKTNIADSDASSITITFRVPVSWLKSNGVLESDILMFRYSSSTWNALPTTKTGNDGAYVTYEAVTPGFSNFAIGSKASAAPIAPTPEEQKNIPPAEQPPVLTEEPKTTTTESQQEIPPKSASSKTTVFIFIIVVILLLAGIGYFLWFQYKRH